MKGQELLDKIADVVLAYKPPSENKLKGIKRFYKNKPGRKRNTQRKKR
jgi:hypothetical protein